MSNSLIGFQVSHILRFTTILFIHQESKHQALHMVEVQYILLNEWMSNFVNEQMDGWWIDKWRRVYFLTFKSKPHVKILTKSWFHQTSLEFEV